MHRLLLLIVAFCIPATALAQESMSYEDILRIYPEAIKTTVTAPTAYVYQAPSLEASFAGRFNQGRRVLAYRKEGDFYAVATETGGAVGYMLLTVLDVPQVPGAAQPPVILRGYIKPSSATIMSVFIPGSGQIYAGEPLFGGAIMATTLGSLIVGYRMSARTREYTCADGSEFCQDGSIHTDYSWLAGSAVVAASAWAVGVLTAAGSARRSNERKGFTAQASIVPIVDDGATRLVFAVRARW